jgi:sugar phosphate isomerase/epimerase
MNETFRHLRNAGYTGFLTGEWFHDQYGPTPEDALERYAADINDLAIRHGVTLG